MTYTDTDIRTRLEAERRTLYDELDAFPIDNQDQSTDYGASQHPADNATDMFLRERNVALRRNIEMEIAQIDHALQRLDEGAYGICERCGREINPERLEVRPSATLCITCQAEVEQR